jgi:hypothetical protein
MSDRQYFDELVRAANAREAKALDEARALALQSGKEPFDLQKFEQIYDTSSDFGRLPPVESRQKRWEQKYYVDYPEIKTIEEFAAQMSEIDPYR